MDETGSSMVCQPRERGSWCPRQFGGSGGQNTLSTSEAGLKQGQDREWRRTGGREDPWSTLCILGRVTYGKARVRESPLGEDVTKGHSRDHPTAGIHVPFKNLICSGYRALTPSSNDTETRGITQGGAPVPLC
ncbi:hypothetical protein MHYP_G00111440 [Metynnis hypsauchen]